MSLIVRKQGLLDSLQDAGRPGYRALGINPGGAADLVSLQMANALVGNDPFEAALELHFPAGTFLFTQPALIALAGTDFGPRLNGDPIPMYHPVRVGEKTVLQFAKPGPGMRAYLALRGGWNNTPWLGSRSTHLQAGFGGWQGRALQENDELPFRNPAASAWQPLPEKSFRVLRWSARPPAEFTGPIRLLPGAEWPALIPASQEALTRDAFTVTPQADRMACRLQHRPLLREKAEELISTAVVPGTLQLLPDGQLLALLSDCQTTGGYPRVGQVISADLHRLAQARPGDSLRWCLTDMASAEAALAGQTRFLQQLQQACRLRLESE